ncbi:MAG: hypothetical protein ACTHNA_14370 [Sphingopyxis terrae]|uniref:hypothetical protein n=1 Tax=Sphingopyxis terrae TaxID=33052 RepID=UPI003F7E3706
MGFLSMIGAVSAEEHNRIVAKKDELIADADYHMKGEDFDGIDDHPGRVALIMARLRAARSRASKDEAELARPRAETRSEQKLSEALHDLEILKESYASRGTTITNLREEIARLKPLAEATERRRANDAKRVRPSRAKKAAPDTVKTGAATGKPRTAIPAKVGGGSAKLSGDRPAKKAVR